jgi:hypothetical protein
VCAGSFVDKVKVAVRRPTALGRQRNHAFMIEVCCGWIVTPAMRTEEKLEAFVPLNCGFETVRATSPVLLIWSEGLEVEPTSVSGNTRVLPSAGVELYTEAAAAFGAVTSNVEMTPRAMKILIARMKAPFYHQNAGCRDRAFPRSRGHVAYPATR